MTPCTRRLAGAVVLLVLTGCSSGQVGSSSLSRSASSASVNGSGTGSVSSATASAAGSSSVTPSGSAPAVPGPTPSGSVTPKPPALPAVRGYGYATAPKAVADAYAAQRAAVVLSAPTVRAVVHDGVSIGTISARTLHSEHVGDTELEQSLVTGLVKGMSGQGYTLRTRTVSGTPVVVAYRKGSTILAWYHRGLVLQLVSSEAEPTGLAFVKAWLAR